MKWNNRYSILAVLFSGYLLCYMDRMVIATALPFIARDLQLSAFEMGGVLSAFFVGYAAMQVPGGMLVDRFGPRRVIALAIVGWSCFTFLTGLAGTLAVLLFIRVLFGVAEGPYPPAASKSVALWFPTETLGRVTGILLASINLGAAVAPLLVAPWVMLWGWRSVFYVLIVPGLLLAIAVWLIFKDSDGSDRLANPNIATGDGKVSITQALRIPAVWACAMTLFFGNMAGWGLMNWLPTYLLQVRGFSIMKTGVYSSVPLVAGIVGYFLGGALSDTLFRRRRRVPIALGLLVSSCMTLVATTAPSGEWAIAALVIVFLFLFIAQAGLYTLPLVLVPKAVVGSVFGVVNTVAQVAAFISPLLIGYILDRSNNFTYVFYLLVGLFFLAFCAAMRIKTDASS